MKIISSTHLKELDKYTIANEPITSIDLMERAATHHYASLGRLFPYRCFCRSRK